MKVGLPVLKLDCRFRVYIRQAYEAVNTALNLKCFLLVNRLYYCISYVYTWLTLCYGYKKLK